MVDKIWLKQIYCSHSRTHNIKNSLFVFLRSTMLLNRNKHIGEDCFVFCKFVFPSILLLTPALALLRLLPVFYVISPINCASPLTSLSKFRSQNC